MRMSVILKILLLRLIHFACVKCEECFGNSIEELNGVITDFHKLGSVQAVSIMECARNCMSNSECASFFYVETSKLCQMHSGLFNRALGGSAVSDEPASKYYKLCNRTQTVLGCPEDAVTKGYIYEAANNFCYRIGFGSASWDVQQAICKSEGGHLFTVTCEDDYNWLKAKTIDTCTGYCEYKIDGTDRVIEGKWLDFEGTPLKWFRWAPEKPDNYGGTQHCMELSNRYPVDGFNDCDCPQENEHFVCQIDMK